MNQVVVIAPIVLPELIASAEERARLRFLEYFAAQIRNPNTRRAYVNDVRTFLAWCATKGVADLAGVSPFHVAGYIEEAGRAHSAPTVKRHLAAIRGLFDWLVTGQIVPHNPALSVRGPKHSQRRGKTPILGADEARALLDAIDVSTLIGLRDRALIATMLFSFGRVSAVAGMKVKDVFVQERRFWLRLHEKGGKEHEMPCHHKLESYLAEWLEASGLKHEPDAPLFPTFRRGTVGKEIAGELTRDAIPQENAYARVRHHGLAAAIATPIGNHSLRGTGITTYLKNGGTIEKARHMANHASTRTTQLYDRRPDDVTLEEVELVRI